MKSVRLEAIGEIFTRDTAKPVPGPDELLVRVEACGVCGTDRHLLHGEFPCTPPVTLGHEFCGIIEVLGGSVSGFAIGERITGDPNIHCGRCDMCQAGRINLCRNLRAIGIHRDGGFADYVVVPQAQAYALPATLNPLHGAFCEPLACCIHGVDMASIKTGASVIVIGGGVIGMLVVQLVRLAGATSVIMVTRQAAKRKLAEELGATASLDPAEGDPVQRLTGPGGLLPGGAHVVIECAGVVETVALAPRLARSGGTVVILGVLPQGAKVEIEPFDILFREIAILGSFINPHTHKRAAAMVASGVIKVDPLISRMVTLDQAPQVIRNPPAAGEIRVLVVPS
jgi:L-iditol 2-dehydrogenase